MKRFVAIAAVAIVILIGIGLRRAGHESTCGGAGGVGAAPCENAVAHALSTSAPIGSTRNSGNTPSIDATPKVSSEMITHNAAAAARAWQANAQRVIEAKDAKEFGAENAALLRLPIDETWKALKARSKSGDEQALILMNRLSSLCDSERTYRRTPLKPDFRARLPEGWAPFVDRLHEMQADAHEIRMSRCDGVGRESFRDFLLDHIDRFLRADNPEAKLAIAGDNPDDAEAIADLRELARETPSAGADAILGNRLLRSSDPSRQNEGRAILGRLAPDNPTVAVELGYCLSEGCDHFVANPSAAMPWIEIAAGLGDQTGLNMMAKALDASNDAAGAWAWSSYALELALAGCFESIAPTYRYIAYAAIDESRRRYSLNAAQHNAGLAEFYAISGRWQRKAMERLSCGG